MALSTRTKVGLTVIAAALLGFVANGHGPLGKYLWPPGEIPADSQPSPAQMVGFQLYGVVEALAFGLGVAFLVFGYRYVRAFGASRGLAVATYLSIGWMLVNWVPHDNLHMHFLHQPAGLLFLEWFFHGSLIAAGLTAATFFLRVARGSQGLRQPRSAPQAGATPASA